MCKCNSLQILYIHTNKGVYMSLCVCVYVYTCVCSYEYIHVQYIYINDKMVGCFPWGRVVIDFSKHGGSVKVNTHLAVTRAVKSQSGGLNSTVDKCCPSHNASPLPEYSVAPFQPKTCT